MINLFGNSKKATPVSTTKTDDDDSSGIAAIRRALHARRSGLATIASDVRVSTEALFAFLNGAKLANVHLEALTDRIWGGSLRYLSDVDALEHAAKKPSTTVNTDCRTPLVIGTAPTAAEVMEKFTRDGPPSPPPTKPAWLRG